MLLDIWTSQIWAILSLILGILGIFLISRFRLGGLISPAVVIIFVLLLIFALRPIFLRAFPSADLYRKDSTSGLYSATMIGFISILFFLLGIWFTKLKTKTSLSLLFQKSTNSSEKPSSDEKVILRSIYIRIWNVHFLNLGIWALILFVTAGSEVFLSLSRGRNIGLGVSLQGLPQMVSVLPMGAPIILCYILNRVAKVRLFTKSEVFQLFVMVTSSALPSLFVGDRRYFLPTILIAFLTVTRSIWSQRIRFIHFGSLFFAYIFIASIPFVRSAGARLDSANIFEAIIKYLMKTPVSEVLTNVFVKNDTEMFDYVAIMTQEIGTSIPFGFGRGTLLDLFKEMVPSSIVQIQSWGDFVAASVFGVGCSYTACPVPSLPGVFFYDFGFIGVAAGFFILGLTMSTFNVVIAERTGLLNAYSLVLYGFLPIIVRGQSVAMLWICLNAILLVTFSYKLAIKKPFQAYLQHSY